MKLVHWMRFAWDLEKLGEPPPSKLPVNCVVRPASRRELDVVQAVIINSFSLDSDWAESYRRIRDRLAEQVQVAMEANENAAMVLAHGPRIIGASVYAADSSSEHHLVSGPCILLEYRNRGLGTDMLYRTLAALKHAGLKRVCAVTKRGVPADKFVYPKFGGEGEPAELPSGFAT